MTYFTGIDVSLRSVSICIVDEHGKVCHEAKVAAQPAAIAQCLAAFSDQVKCVGLEAGALTQYLTYGLQAAGFEVVCMEARQVKDTLASMRNKTGRNDARGIAQILRTGWYSRVHVKSMDSHRVRALLASGKAILKKCVDLEKELRGLLRVFGICLAPRVGTATSMRTCGKPSPATRCLAARSLLCLTRERCCTRPPHQRSAPQVVQPRSGTETTVGLTTEKSSASASAGAAFCPVANARDSH